MRAPPAIAYYVALDTACKQTSETSRLAAGPLGAGQADMKHEEAADEAPDAPAPHQEVGTRSMRAAVPPAAAGGHGGAPGDIRARQGT